MTDTTTTEKKAYVPQQKPGLLQRKFMVPTSAVGLGIGNQALEAGLPPWLIIAIMASSLIYAGIEAWIDINRMKLAAAQAPVQVVQTSAVEKPPTAN